ncbi:MAG: DUF4870 domain-containing protein [Phycisphaerales bacterium]
MHDAHTITPPSEQERSWAMLIHLLAGVIAVVATPLFSVGYTVVMWLVKKDESGFIDDHGREATNFWISLLLYSIILLPLAAVITCGLGVILYIPLLIIAIVGVVQSTIAAKNGEYYRYPATIRLL